MQGRRLFLCFLMSASCFLFVQGMDLGDFSFSFDDILDEVSCDVYEELKLNRDRDDESLTPKQLLALLVGVGVPNILYNDFYYHTNPINMRPLFDLPALRAPLCPRCGFNFSFDPYYNQTRKAYFTKRSPYIKSYLNISDPDLLESLDDIQIPGFSFDIPEILPLFYTIKEEERRAGIMFDFSWFYKNWLALARIPLCYGEHNFYVTPAEVDSVKQSKFIRQFGSSGSDSGDSQAMAFARKHIINDRIGLGDMRLEFMRYSGRLFQRSEASLLWGLECAIPSAFNFKDGLFGSSFGSCGQPDFSFWELVNLILSDQEAGVEQAVNFGVGVIDRLSSMLINVPLGQRFLSVGPVARYTHTLNTFCEVVVDAKIDYWVPRKEKRYFLVCKDYEGFERDWSAEAIDAMTEQQAQGVLGFLSEQAVNTFYPICYTIKINPGVVAQCSTSLHAWWHHMNLIVGTDFWYKTREHIAHDQESCPLECLYLERGIRPMAVQAKIFGDLFVSESHLCKRWRFGIHGDWTIARYGLGRDFTLALQCEVNY